MVMMTGSQSLGVGIKYLILAIELLCDTSSAKLLNFINSTCGMVYSVYLDYVSLISYYGDKKLSLLKLFSFGYRNVHCIPDLGDL